MAVTSKVKWTLKEIFSKGNAKEALRDSTIQDAAENENCQTKVVSNKMLALEPRIMFDAAALSTVVDVVTEEQSFSTAQTESTVDSQLLLDALSQSQPQAITSVLFVDTAVEDYQSLIDDVKTGTRVVILGANYDGVQQMAEVLSKYSALESIQILSHGEQGQVNLGNTALNTSSLNEYQSAIQSWGNSLTETGDILFYGCNVAEGSALESDVVKTGSAEEVS